MTIEDLYQKSCKQYIYFLKFTNPNSKLFDIAPKKLLELLDNSYRRKMKLKEMLLTHTGA